MCLLDVRKTVEQLQFGVGTRQTVLPGVWISRGPQPLRSPCAVAMLVHVAGSAAGEVILVDGSKDMGTAPADLACLWLEVRPDELSTALAGTITASEWDEDGIFHGIARLLAMATQEWERKVLAPIVRKELVIALLRHPRTRKAFTASPRRRSMQKLYAVIEWLGTHFDEPLPVDSLASMACMSPSAFHQRFREATGLSPLQFVKQVRLRQAHHLLIAESETAASVAYRVGYTSPSHFSRDYARVFGLPPVRHVAQLRCQTH